MEPAVNRVGLRQQVEQQHAEAVDVTRSGGLLEAEDLGRHVDRRPERYSPGRTIGLRQPPPGAEVHQHEAAAILAHDVLRLDVVVDHLRGMDGRQGPAQRGGAREHLIRPHPAVAGDHLRERLPGDEFHADAHVPIRIAGIMDRHDVVMPDAGEPSGFVERVLDLAGVAFDDGDELQRDRLAQRRVMGPVHAAEAAAPDLFLDDEVRPGGPHASHPSPPTRGYAKATGRRPRRILTRRASWFTCNRTTVLGTALQQADMERPQMIVRKRARANTMRGRQDPHVEDLLRALLHLAPPARDSRTAGADAAPATTSAGGRAAALGVQPLATHREPAVELLDGRPVRTLNRRGCPAAHRIPTTRTARRTTP
jgi:hypothetical protein